MVLCTCLFVSLFSCKEGKDIDAFNKEINASIQDYLVLRQEDVVVRIIGEISKQNGGTIQCLNCVNNELEYFNSKKFISSFMKYFGNAKEDEKYRFSLRVDSVSNTYGFQLFKSDMNHDFQKEKMVFNCNGSYVIHLDKIEKPMPEIKEESYAEGHYSTFTFLNHEFFNALSEDDFDVVIRSEYLIPPIQVVYQVNLNLYKEQKPKVQPKNKYFVIGENGDVKPFLVQPN